MALELALLQAASEPGRELYIILGVITLATLVALGLRFFSNMFEVITAPGASLGHHGQNDNFFFSIFVVFLGGLIGAFALLAQQRALVQLFHEYAVKVCNDVAMLNNNENYREIAARWGYESMDANFDVFVASNLVFFPILMVLIWLLVGTICFAASKLFGGTGTYGGVLGSLAYGSFFASIGLGFVALLGMEVAMSGGREVPTVSVLAIIGLLLLIYALVLFLMGISQSSELTAGQVVGIIIVLLIVLGGIGYGIYYVSTPPWDTFKLAIQQYDPSTGIY